MSNEIKKNVVVFWVFWWILLPPLSVTRIPRKNNQDSIPQDPSDWNIYLHENHKHQPFSCRPMNPYGNGKSPSVFFIFFRGSYEFFCARAMAMPMKLLRCRCGEFLTNGWNMWETNWLIIVNVRIMMDHVYNVILPTWDSWIPRWILDVFFLISG